MIKGSIWNFPSFLRQSSNIGKMCFFKESVGYTLIVLQNISCGYRKSRSQTFLKIGVLKKFTNFTGKHLCRSLFLTKLQAGSATLLNRGSNTVAFLWNLHNF